MYTFYGGTNEFSPQITEAKHIFVVKRTCLFLRDKRKFSGTPSHDTLIPENQTCDTFQNNDIRSSTITASIAIIYSINAEIWNVNLHGK